MCGAVPVAGPAWRSTNLRPGDEEETDTSSVCADQEVAEPFLAAVSEADFRAGATPIYPLADGARH